MNRFFQGLSAWVQGWKFIVSNGSLARLVIVPFLISIVLVAGALIVSVNYLPQISEYFMGLMLTKDSWWYDVLYYPVMVVAGVMATVLAVYLAYILHSIIAAPFYSAMVERTLQLTGKAPTDFGSRREAFSNSLTMLRVGLAKSALLLLLSVLFIPLSFIPGVNLLVALALFMIFAADAFDYTLEAHRLRLRQRVSYLRGNKGIWAGMATGLLVTLLLPGLTLLVMPGAVVGAALILDKPGLD